MMEDAFVIMEQILTPDGKYLEVMLESFPNRREAAIKVFELNRISRSIHLRKGSPIKVYFVK